MSSSRLWPQPEFAEDLPLFQSRVILTTHVLHRGFQAGSTLGLIVGAARVIPSIIRSAPANNLTNATATATSTPTLLSRAQSATPTIVRSIGVGAVLGLGAMSVLLPLRMANVDPVGWQDRSWRLLGNQGQIEVDNWSLAGMALAVVAIGAGAPVRRRMMMMEAEGKRVSRGVLVKALGLGWKAAVGGVGMGSLLGVLGYLVWRNGIRRMTVSTT